MSCKGLTGKALADCQKKNKYPESRGGNVKRKLHNKISNYEVGSKGQGYVFQSKEAKNNMLNKLKTSARKLDSIAFTQDSLRKVRSSIPLGKTEFNK